MISEYIPKNNKWFFINILGTAIAFAAVLLVSSYTIHELSFDKFHSKADNIYRLQIDEPGRVGFMETADDMNSATVGGYYLSSLFDQFSEIKDVALMTSTFNLSLKVGEETYNLDNTYHADHSFFNLFDFKLLYGNKSTLFTNPNEVVLSKKAALKYFGEVNVLGKEVKIKHEFAQNDGDIYTVKAVFDDFPVNSHMSPHMLISEKSEDLQNPYGYAFTYLHLQKGNSADQLTSSLNKYWKKNVKEGELAPTFKLIPLKDIHLTSHKKDEFGINGNMNSILVLIFGAIIVFLIAVVNYSNLNYVQFVSSLKDLKVRIVNGASVMDLSLHQAGRSLMQTAVAIIIGTLLVVNFSKLSGFKHEFDFSISLFLIISLLFALIFGIIKVLPLFSKNISSHLNKTPEQGSKKFVFSLVFQFVLSISAIIITIVLHGQISFVQKIHPGKDKEALISITEFPYAAIDKFDVFKEKALKHPEIKNVSATMVPPGMVANFSYPIEMDGIANKEEVRMTICSVEKDFFKLMGIEPLAGNLNLKDGSSVAWESAAISPSGEMAKKNIQSLDKSHTDFKEQYILNETALKSLGFSSPEQVIGKSFKYNFRSPEYFKKGEVVAVVKDLHYGDMFAKEVPTVMALKRIFNGTYLVEIDKNNKAKAIAALQKEWSSLFPDYPIKYSFVDDEYKKIYRNQYNEMKALTLFAILSILLSTLGMFALSSYSIQHKTKEIGIRKANGANSLEILFELIFEYTQWVALAFIIACPTAYYIAKDWLSNFAYKIEMSWWIFALAGVIALAITIMTVSWQTWKAARQNPVYALKYE